MHKACHILKSNLKEQHQWGSQNFVVINPVLVPQRWSYFPVDINCLIPTGEVRGEALGLLTMRLIGGSELSVWNLMATSASCRAMKKLPHLSKPLSLHQLSRHEISNPDLTRVLRGHPYAHIAVIRVIERAYEISVIIINTTTKT